jgi:hypothetical protein
MADKVSDSITPENGVTVTPAGGTGEQVPREDLNRLRSVKDREIARERKRADAERKAREELESRLAALEEQFADPATRAKMKQDRLEARLARYEERENLAAAKREVMQEYGIPAEVLEDADSDAELGLAVVNFLKSERQKLIEQLGDTSRTRSIDAAEASGALDVNVSAGPADGGAVAPDIDTEFATKARKERRSVFQDWYNAGTNAQKGGTKPPRV